MEETTAIEQSKLRRVGEGQETKRSWGYNSTKKIKVG